MKHRWHQIHLSTAIVMTLVTGGLLGLNCRPAIEILEHEGSVVFTLARVYRYGWPAPMYTAVEETKGVGNVTEDGTVHVIFGDLSPSATQSGWHFLDWNKLAVNALGLITALLAVTFLCEWHVRRSERTRLPAQSSNAGSKPCQ